MTLVQMVVAIFAAALVFASVPAMADGAFVYPVNQVDRPLTIPFGVWEAQVGGKTVFWRRNSSDRMSTQFGHGDPAVHFNLRYGIDSKLEFNTFGLKWRPFSRLGFFDSALKFGITDIGSSSSDGFITDIEAGVETKTVIMKDYAALFKIEDFYGYREKSGDTNELRFSLGPLISFTSRTSVEATLSYKRLSGYAVGDEWGGGGALRYNHSESFDLAFSFASLTSGRGNATGENTASMEYLLAVAYRW